MTVKELMNVIKGVDGFTIRNSENSDGIYYQILSKEEKEKVQNQTVKEILIENYGIYGITAILVIEEEIR